MRVNFVFLNCPLLYMKSEWEGHIYFLFKNWEIFTLRGLAVVDNWNP